MEASTEVKDKIIRKFKDNKGNKYIIFRKNNGHYSLVEFSNGVGTTIATTKATIFNSLKEIYKNNNLEEVLR